MSEPANPFSNPPSVTFRRYGPAETKAVNEAATRASVPGAVLFAAMPELDPGIRTKIGRLRGEMRRWIKAGMKVVPKEVRAARLALCEACPYYKPTENFGLGRCAAPGCSCSRLKLALATSRCPHPQGPRWLPYDPASGPT